MDYCITTQKKIFPYPLSVYTEVTDTIWLDAPPVKHTPYPDFFDGSNKSRLYWSIFRIIYKQYEISRLQ